MTDNIGRRYFSGPEAGRRVTAPAENIHANLCAEAQQWSGQWRMGRRLSPVVYKGARSELRYPKVSTAFDYTYDYNPRLATPGSDQLLQTSSTRASLNNSIPTWQPKQLPPPAQQLSILAKASSTIWKLAKAPSQLARAKSPFATSPTRR